MAGHYLAFSFYNKLYISNISNLQTTIKVLHNKWLFNSLNLSLLIFIEQFY